jgi:alanyl-tRNA synthetase
MGDQGHLVTASGAEMRISDTVKQRGSLHVHKGTVLKGTVSPGDIVRLMVDGERRALLRANHSATHLLHAALRQVLGNHVAQKGSLVAPDRLRFDFTHTKTVSQEEISAVERLVNQHIIMNHEVVTRLMDTEQAINHGALALFGERYGDEVRVLSIGTPSENSLPFSVELCGGTHVRRTGDIGMFKIINEVGVASGVRRIEAVTGLAALDHITKREATLAHVEALTKSTVADLPIRVGALLTERKALERQVTDLRRQLTLLGTQNEEGGHGQQEIEKIVGSYKVVERHLKDVPAKDLKALVDGLKQKMGSGIVIVTSIIEGKVSLVVGVTQDLTGCISAIDLVRLGAQALGGSGGGGRPDLAQAGATNTAVSGAITAIKNYLKNQ